MRMRIGCALALCCLYAIFAIAAETGIEGTWVTDGVAVYQAAKAAGKSLSNLPEAETIKFKVDTKKNKLTGTITEMVTAKVYDVEDGKVKDKTFTFNSVDNTLRNPTPLAWKGELKDEATISLQKLSASGQPSGNPLVIHRAK